MPDHRLQRTRDAYADIDLPSRESVMSTARPAHELLVIHKGEGYLFTVTPETLELIMPREPSEDDLWGV